MFSVQQKREIAAAVQRILRDTNHPELPVGEIQFSLHVAGAESWSWADIRNNGSVTEPDVNPWNELHDHFSMALSPSLPNGAVIVYREKVLDRWIVLCRREKSDVQHEWVTWCCDNEGDAFWGHYFSDDKRAKADYKQRVEENKNLA
jgi:hypothetical protein